MYDGTAWVAAFPGRVKSLDNTLSNPGILVGSSGSRQRVHSRDFTWATGSEEHQGKRVSVTLQGRRGTGLGSSRPPVCTQACNAVLRATCAGLPSTTSDTFPHVDTSLLAVRGPSVARVAALSEDVLGTHPKTTLPSPSLPLLTRLRGAGVGSSHPPMCTYAGPS
ncbi:uncharacterized protein LOC144155488 [Haemaphysalis longicornis]